MLFIKVLVDLKLPSSVTFIKKQGIKTEDLLVGRSKESELILQAILCGIFDQLAAARVSGTINHLLENTKVTVSLLPYRQTAKAFILGNQMIL